MQLPYLPPWTKTLLGGLLAAYIAELVARNAGVPTDALAWHAPGAGFQPWQPLTFPLVQGGNVLGVVIGLLVLALVLPVVDTMVGRRTWLRALGAAWAGSVGAAGLVAASGFGSGPPHAGWSDAVLALFVVFGLANPNAIVKLFFVIDVRAAQLVWGALLVAGFFFVADPSLPTAGHLGAWLGTYGFWRWRGRRAEPSTAAGRPKPPRPRFEVIEGGRADAPRNQRPTIRRDADSDDMVH